MTGLIGVVNGKCDELIPGKGDVRVARKCWVMGNDGERRGGRLHGN